MAYKHMEQRQHYYLPKHKLREQIYITIHPPEWLKF